MQKYDTIIFDLGGVLIDWNPRYVYKQLFLTTDATEHFLNTVCTSHWNEEQDAGRPFHVATALKKEDHPEYSTEIDAYYGRWREMLSGSIKESVEILKSLKEAKSHRIVALTNWSAESFPIALDIFEFLHWFEGILVSGEEDLKKPDPAIFELLLSRYNIDREKAIFIDDNIANVHASRKLGIETIHFVDAESCRSQLEGLIGQKI